MDDITDKVKEELEIRFSRVVPEEHIKSINEVRLFGNIETFFHNFLNRNFQFPNGENSPRLTPYGRKLRKFIKGKEFYDLGCGKLDFSQSGIKNKSNISYLSKRIGAELYVGVDNDPNVFGPIMELNEDSEIRDIYQKFREGNTLQQLKGGYQLIDQILSIRIDYNKNFNSAIILDDMLGFVSKMDQSSGSVFFFSGLEEERSPDNMDIGENGIPLWKPTNEVYIDYFRKLSDELGRVALQGDLVIVEHCAAFNGRDLEEHGFKFDDNMRLYIKG